MDASPPSGPEPTLGPGACPTCGQPLVHHEVQGVAFASCHEHGRWLTHEALVRLVAELEGEAKSKHQAARRRVRRLIRRRRKARGDQSHAAGASLATLLLSGLDLG